jgi:hypothetical protein
MHATHTCLSFPSSGGVCSEDGKRPTQKLRLGNNRLICKTVTEQQKPIGSHWGAYPAGAIFSYLIPSSSSTPCSMTPFRSHGVTAQYSRP